MTLIKSTLAIAAMMFAVGSTGVMAAETAASDTAKPAVTKIEHTAKIHKAKLIKSNKTPEQLATMSAKSKECSAKADAQNLHGKERKAFRHECKKAA